MEKGRLPDLQGKGLDDIVIDPQDEVDVSDDDSGEDVIADLHQSEGSRIKTTSEQTHQRWMPESITQGSMKMGTTHPRNDSQDNTALSVGTSEAPPKHSLPKRAVKTMERRKWTRDEVDAVERHMTHFITKCRVPGKRDCDSCL
ncbi:hypothetical protein LDENG_00196880, partial [Lucifuga dentata]